jgi:hypothetical protein
MQYRKGGSWTCCESAALGCSAFWVHGFLLPAVVLLTLWKLAEILMISSYAW